MASTYSSNLKIELMGTGENSGTWGTITNTNLGTALEQAVVGLGNPDFIADANLTISITDSNAAQAARALVLNVTSSFGSLTVTRELIVPTSQKQYIVQNNTTGGQSITVKTSAGTGITVPNGRKAHLYANGTDVIQMFDFVDVNGGAIDGTVIGGAAAAAGTFTTATATTGNITTVNATTVDTTNLEVTNIKAKDGTASATIADSTGVMTIGSSVLTTTDINGGAIDGTTVGAASASTGAFTTLSATGVTTVQAGSAGAPAITTTGDTNTGIFFPAADTIAFSEGGAEAMRIDSSGNVGIGTSSPRTKLDVSGSVLVGTYRTSSTYATLNVKPTSITTPSTFTNAINIDNGTSVGEYSNITFGYNTLGLTNAPAYFGFVSTSSSGGGKGDLVFGTRDVTTDTAATERMRITSAGNVGIGTSSPTTAGGRAIHIANSSGDSRLHLTDNTTGATADDGTEIVVNGGNLYIDQKESQPIIILTGSTERMRIDASGNVAIGSTTATSRANIWGANIATGAGATASHGQLSVWSTSTYGANIGGTLALGGDGGTFNNITYATVSGRKENGSINNYDAYLAFAVSKDTSNTVVERMRIDSSGNVGIGTSSPTQALTVNGQMLSIASSGASFKNITPTTGNNFMWLGNTGNNLYVGKESSAGATLFVGSSAYAAVIGNDGAYPLQFATDNNVRATIDSSGNLLVGTTGLPVANGRLSVSASSGETARFYNSGGNGSPSLALDKSTTTNTSSQLFAVFTINNQGTGSGQINANGANAAAFGSFSDQRLKENIVDLPSQLPNILALRPVEFDYIESEGGGHQISFIAQEIQQVYPDVVGERGDGMLTVTGWSKTEARLVKAIQEQQALITALTTRITALESK